MQHGAGGRTATLSNFHPWCCRRRGNEEAQVAARFPAPTEPVLGTPRHRQLHQPSWSWPLSRPVGQQMLAGHSCAPALVPKQRMKRRRRYLRTRFSSSTAWYVIFAVALRPLQARGKKSISPVGAAGSNPSTWEPLLECGTGPHSGRREASSKPRVWGWKEVQGRCWQGSLPSPVPQFPHLIKHSRCPSSCARLSMPDTPLGPFCPIPPGAAPKCWLCPATLQQP